MVSLHSEKLSFNACFLVSYIILLHHNGNCFASHFHRVYTVRENQGKTYLFRDGQGKSGKIRESQGIQQKSQGKLGKSQGDFFGKFLPPMNQNPLFILAIVCQTSLTSYFSLYLDIFLL